MLGPRLDRRSTAPLMDKGEIVEDALKDDFFDKPHSDRAQQFLFNILQH